MHEFEEVRTWNWVEQDQISPGTKQALLREGWTEAGDDLVSPGFVEEMKRRVKNHDPGQDISLEEFLADQGPELTS